MLLQTFAPSTLLGALLLGCCGAQVLETVPTCASLCSNNLLDGVYGCTTSDPQCYCEAPAGVDYLSCARAACPAASDWAQVVQVAENNCLIVGVDVSAQISSFTASNPAPATATSVAPAQTAAGQGSSGGGQSSGGSSSSKSINPGIIAGAVVGGVVVIAIIVTAFFLVRRSRKRRALARGGGADASRQPDMANAPASEGAIETAPSLEDLGNADVFVHETPVDLEAHLKQPDVHTEPVNSTGSTGRAVRL